jgi:hypothetical protein
MIEELTRQKDPARMNLSTFPPVQILLSPDKAVSIGSLSYPFAFYIPYMQIVAREYYFLIYFNPISLPLNH